MAFANECAQVLVLDRDTEAGSKTVEEVVSAGGIAHFLACDVASQGEVEGAFDAAIENYGPIDVLINNAGIASTSPLLELSLEQWNEMISIDLTGVFLTTKAIVPSMIERRSGRIINIASQLGIRGAPMMVHYCAAKAGVLGLTRALARELIPYGIRVNAIAPGPTLTDATRAAPEETLDAIRAELPIDRFAQVEEIAPTAVMLASSDGDYYVGSTLNVSGGHVM